MLNSICIMGRFVRDIHVKTTNTGTNIVNVPIACDRYASGQKTTDFFDIVAFGNNAKFISEHFKKGDSVIITGRLQSRTWQTDAGETRKAVEICVNNVDFAGGKTSAAETTVETSSAEETTVGSSSAAGMPFEV